MISISSFWQKVKDYNGKERMLLMQESYVQFLAILHYQKQDDDIIHYISETTEPSNEIIILIDYIFFYVSSSLIYSWNKVGLSYSRSQGYKKAVWLILKYIHIKMCIRVSMVNFVNIQHIRLLKIVDLILKHVLI